MLPDSEGWCGHGGTQLTSKNTAAASANSSRRSRRAWRHGFTAYQSRQDIGGKMFLVRVIVDRAVDPAVVVTVYRTTKLQKYWRAP